MGENYRVARVDDVESSLHERAGVDHLDLVAQLQCDDLRPRILLLEPGEAVTYHRQTEQEELYVLLQGPGRMRVGGDLLDIDEWTTVWVPPETPRQVLNDGESGTHVWLVVATPGVENDGELLGERGAIHRDP